MRQPIHSNWQDLFEQLQKAVVDGRHAICRNMLIRHNPQKIPREWASQFAELAVRSHQPLFALKALHSFVYPENSFGSPATNLERMTYARSLYHLGAVEESIELLNGIDQREEPEALFLRACANIFQWNYPATIADIKTFLASDSIAPYRRVVGKVNLAAALVNVSDWVKAEKLLREIQTECEAQGYLLLLGNCFELRSQLELFQGHFDEALQCLEKAQALLKDQDGLYALYVEKWTIICRCLKSNGTSDLRQLEDLRQKAFQLGHWSTLRECDLFQAIATGDKEMLKKVIMGTPSEFYRQRARKLFNTDIPFRGQYLWKLKGEKEGSQQVFNPYRKTSDRPALYEKPLLLSLFEALTLDFYQPSRLGLLFKKVYPQEKFNPFSSPARVLQLLRRLDGWFRENGIPLRVRFKKSEFTLKTLEDIEILVERGRDFEHSAKGRQVADLKLLLHDRTMSVEKIAQTMKISETAVRRLLKHGVAEGKVKKLGSGRGTAYQALTARKKKEAA